MALAIRNLKVYLKLVLIVAVLLVIAMVLIFNRKHNADVWFFGKYEDVNVVWLMTLTAVGSIFAFWVLGTARRLWRDMREMHAEEQVQVRRQQTEALSQRLAEQEKRIDDKIKQSIEGE